MKKLGYVIAAISVIAIAAPSIASAETIVIKHRDHGMRHDHGWRHDHAWRHDHGWRHHERRRHEG